MTDFSKPFAPLTGETLMNKAFNLDYNLNVVQRIALNAYHWEQEFPNLVRTNLRLLIGYFARLLRLHPRDETAIILYKTIENGRTSFA